MVSVGWLGLHYYLYVQVHGKDIQFIKRYYDKHICYFCVSVFSTDMHSSQDHVDFCTDIISSQCALHKHHNLNNLGIRQEIWQHLFGKIDFVF